MGKTLLQKVWDAHAVRQLPTGQTQLFVGLHLVHEVTSPQAFDMIRARGLGVAFPHRTFATVDHIVPTANRTRPFLDTMAEEMLSSLERNCREHGIPLYDLGSENQGIVHVIGPELGLTQPGMTIACGDSHTSTHGAFGSVAFGIGTSQVRDVLASQCLAMEPLKVRRITVTGQLPPGVYAKDVILTIIQRLGVKGGAGFAYEYAGPVIERMSMDERMTICNMSIEGAARVGYVNPDRTTFEFLQGRAFAPQGTAFDEAVRWWSSIASDRDARYDDEVTLAGAEIEPTVTWGINPGQSVGIDGRLPAPGDAPARGPGRHCRGPHVHGFRGGPADCGHADQRRLHRLVHEQPVVGPARGRADRPRPEGRARRARAGRARVGPRAARRGGGGPAHAVHRLRLRVARGRLLDVPGDEPRPAARPRDLRVLVEPQLQGPPGEPHRADAADVAGDGRGGGDCRGGRGRAPHGRARGVRMSAGPLKISRVTGRALPLRGNDIDTDRIIPARFLVAVSFEGLEKHVFEDDRKDGGHAFDAPQFQGARVLFVNRNFGCGSSREHAPQAIQRWGIQAIVGEGYSEIFFGNSVQLGLPCVTVDAAGIEALQAAAESAPATEFTVDLETMTVTGGGATVRATMPAAARDALTTGLWDGTGLLLADFDAVKATAERLPYISGFGG